MRMRVRFRYDARTGQVEMFTVDAVDADTSAADHDRRHDRAAAEVARVVESNPLIEESDPGPPAHRVTDAADAATPLEQAHGPAREGPRRG
jgi:hypothetical protein